MDILDLARRNQQKARKIIEDTKIIPIWESIGARVNLVGSLSTGLLMKHLDIDFHIYTSQFSLCDSFQAMVKFTENKSFMKMEHKNLLDTEEACVEWHAWYRDADNAPNQTETDQVECTVLNLKNGEMFSPTLVSIPRIHLTQRELEILQLIQKGLLSKEIAHNLCISIHTVNIHRQNLLHKLGVQNSIEAINAGLKSGILS